MAIPIISVTGYKKWGCPHCGLLPKTALDPNWQLVGEFGDFATCLCKGEYQVVPDRLSHELDPHPRMGKPANICDCESSYLLPNPIGPDGFLETAGPSNPFGFDIQFPGTIHI